MALLDDVKDRYGPAQLEQLTNNAPGSLTIDDTLLGKVVSDVEAAFVLKANVTYDTADSVHVLIGVEGVVLRLCAFKRESKSALADWDRWIAENMPDLRMQTHNNRISPRSTSGRRPEVPRYQEHMDMDGLMRELVPTGHNKWPSRPAN